MTGERRHSTEHVAAVSLLWASEEKEIAVSASAPEVCPDIQNSPTVEQPI